MEIFAKRGYLHFNFAHSDIIAKFNYNNHYIVI